MAASIEIVGMDRLLTQLGRIERVHTVLRDPMERGTEQLHRAMAQEPGPIPAGHWRANTTPRQRRAFFAMLRSGAISGGRSGRYSRSWQSEIRGLGGGMEGHVFTDVPYAPFVGQQGKQAAFLRGRWVTVEETVAKLGPGIVRDFEQAIQRALP